MIMGFIMSLGMFSTIPVPKNSWNEKYIHLVIPSLPVVGLLIGLLWYGTAQLLIYLNIPTLMASVVTLLVPFFLSGFIHVDGFMDTADAVLSRRPLEEKKRILKDPCVGVFAVVAIISLLLLQFSAVYTLFESSRPLYYFIIIPVASRLISGIALIIAKPMPEDYYNAAFRSHIKYRHIIFMAVIFVVCICFRPLQISMAASIACAWYLYRHFKGLSGDLCGCIIVVSECTALVVTALWL